MYLDRQIVEHVLTQLRVEDWQEGFARLRREIDETREVRLQNAMRAFLGWVAAERGAHRQALGLFHDIVQPPEDVRWAQVGLAFVAMRESDYGRAHAWLDATAVLVKPAEIELAATIDHVRGVLYLREDQLDKAEQSLCRAFKAMSNQPFPQGRILDSLGMVFNAKDNFYAAYELFQRSISVKHQLNDLSGMAVSYGNLGRLFLSWGLLDQAETAFRADLTITRHHHDRFGQTVMYNWLGKVELARGLPDRAIALMTPGLELSQHLALTTLEGYLRQDYAVAALMLSDLESAEREVVAAERIFQASSNVTGLALTSRVAGMLYRAQGDYVRSETRLQFALCHFISAQQWDEAARTHRELALTWLMMGRGRECVVGALNDALELAERSRRHWLIRELETELQVQDEACYLQRLYHRARGRDVVEDTASLLGGVSEIATILFLDLQGSTMYGATTDPEVVMITFNQMMAQFSEILDGYHATISGYRGDGFMAILRGGDHALRGVRAGLEMLRALEAFNVPRRILDIKPFVVRLGISTGTVCLGNVGTYTKMDFTAIGSAANLAARLEAQAIPGMPCISQSTYQWVKPYVEFDAFSPRLIKAKGFEETELWVWDVKRYREEQMNAEGDSCAPG